MLDPDESDVLQINGLSRAIERAERVIRDRASSTSVSDATTLRRTLAASVSSFANEPADDIFDSLVNARSTPTDDAIGPAVHAPYIPTPIPPPAPTLPLIGSVPPPRPVAVPLGASGATGTQPMAVLHESMAARWIPTPAHDAEPPALGLGRATSVNELRNPARVPEGRWLVSIALSLVLAALFVAIGVAHHHGILRTVSVITAATPLPVTSQGTPVPTEVAAPPTIVELPVTNVRDLKDVRRKNR